MDHVKAFGYTILIILGFALAILVIGTWPMQFLFGLLALAFCVWLYSTFNLCLEFVRSRKKSRENSAPFVMSQELKTATKALKMETDDLRRRIKDLEIKYEKDKNASRRR